MSQRFESFTEFWPFYVGEHSQPATRAFHFVGTALLIPILIYAIFYNAYFLILLPLSGYGFAWYSHFFIEKNRPATFRYPFWSLLADFRMFTLMCMGKMQAELGRCEKLSTDQIMEETTSDNAFDGM